MYSFSQLREILEQRYRLYNQPAFIETDPISVPHRFVKPADIEVSAFLTATIAWGRRQSIIANATGLMQRMDNAPFDFVMNAGECELKRIEGFVHRTFNTSDCLFFLASLRNIYLKHGGLQQVFQKGYQANSSMFEALIYFRDVFIETECLPRSHKHIANVGAGASAKRLNMYLRWMIRHDEGGVDFGLWQGIPASALYIPLDVHSGKVARQLQLLERKQNDWKAVEELTVSLRRFDANDPVKYDFALFGIGAFEI
jgi:uncharacterized protein (TIGR02757 family)